LDGGVYITYHPSGLPLDGAAFPVTTCLPYRLLGNAIQQELDRHISPPIVEITPTDGEKGGEEGEGEEGEGEEGEGEEGEGEEGGAEGGAEGEEREEGEEQFELKEGWEKEWALGWEATTVEDLLPNGLGEFLDGSPLLWETEVINFDLNPWNVGSEAVDT